MRDLTCEMCMSAASDSAAVIWEGGEVVMFHRLPLAGERSEKEWEKLERAPRA
jgi:hypothetical protein